MNSEVHEKTIQICVENKIDIRDISNIKKIALNRKMYDVFLYVNNHSLDYLKKIKKSPKH